MTPMTPFINTVQHGCTIEVLEWIGSFVARIIIDVITYPCWDQS